MTCSARGVQLRNTFTTEEVGILHQHRPYGLCHMHVVIGLLLVGFKKGLDTQQLLVVLDKCCCCLMTKRAGISQSSGSRGNSAAASDGGVMKICSSASVAVYLKGVGPAGMSRCECSLEGFAKCCVNNQPSEACVGPLCSRWPPFGRDFNQVLLISPSASCQPSFVWRGNKLAWLNGPRTVTKCTHSTACTMCTHSNIMYAPPFF